MSKRNWADEEESSDEGSADEEEETVEASPQQQQQQQQQRYNGNAPAGRKPQQQHQQHVSPDLVCYLANIDHAVDRQAVGLLFSNNQCNIDRLDLKEGDQRGRIAYISFKDQKSMDTALSLNGTSFEGRKLIVKRLGDNGPSGNSSNNNNRQAGGGSRDVRKMDDRKPSRPQRREEEHRGAPVGGRGHHMPPHTAAAAAGPAAASDAPASRPRLQLQQRTKPVDEIGQPTAANAAIFGGGKANEVNYLDEVSQRAK
jgi:hypothetical protein